LLCAIARNLDDEQLDAIKGLESDLGLTIVAFACRQVDPAREERLRQIEAELGPALTVPPARPDDLQLTRIRETEERLGLSLVAVAS
jgi:microsomal dipeptidase-like Zn-dependent dipeptidase